MIPIYIYNTTILYDKLHQFAKPLFKNISHEQMVNVQNIEIEVQLASIYMYSHVCTVH